MMINPLNTAIATDQIAYDAQYYRGVLHGLIDAGAKLAAQIGEQAAPGTPAADIALAFERIARSVRRCIALARKMDMPPTASRTRAAARVQISRAVADTIHRHADEDDAEALEAELDERLDDPAMDEAIDERPVADIIAEICRDLGLAAPPGTDPWKRRTPADVVLLRARAAAQTNRCREDDRPLAGPGQSPGLKPEAFTPTSP